MHSKVRSVHTKRERVERSLFVFSIFDDKEADLPEQKEEKGKQ